MPLVTRVLFQKKSKIKSKKKPQVNSLQKIKSIINKRYESGLFSSMLAEVKPKPLSRQPIHTNSLFLVINKLYGNHARKYRPPGPIIRGFRVAL